LPSAESASAGEVRDDRLQRLEAVLFLAREPLNSRKLSQYANLADGTEARTLIRLLNQRYDEAGRAFRVEEMAGGFRLMTRPKFGPWLKRLAHVPGEVRLSAPALETLAVVAYRQPVLKAAIEAIRGVNCGEVLRQLMERDLVRIVGRSEELGRPYLYGPTRRFLEVFGLRSLDDLPPATPLRAAVASPAVEAPTAEQQPETNTRFTSHPQQENEAVRTQELADELPIAPWIEAESGVTAPVLAAEDEDFEEEGEGEDYEDEFEDDEFEDEDLDEEFDEEEDLEEEEWEYEDDEDDGELEEEFEEEEWEEVEGDEEDLEEDEDWDEEDDEEEEWEDD
jgi:segregation and condensation protein B